MPPRESDLGPAFQRLLSESQERQTKGLQGRERTAELLAAAAFLAAAVPIAALAPTHRPFDAALAIVFVLAFALAARVEFWTGAGWTVPTQLVFVPMLFLLPARDAPLLVAAGLLLAKLPDYWSGRVRADRAVIAIGDAWYAIGPALVLAAGGAGAPDWGDWPLYIAALGSQFACDLAASMLRAGLGLRIKPRLLLPELGLVYAIDAALAPVGLLVAFASIDDRYAFLLTLPLIGLIATFARERQARVENALALGHAYRGTAMLLSEVLSDTDAYTGSHSRSVVVLAHQVGARMGLDESGMRDVEFAALLHDVGKIVVPPEIINKPGALTAEELEVVRTHVVRGEQMLERIGGVLAEVGQLIRSHHERFDGTGYPDGLTGDEIPIEARVVCCCDAFNAMVTDRPYRGAMPVAAAIAELRAHSGTQFDPGVVEVLISVVREWERGAAPSASKHHVRPVPA